MGSAIKNILFENVEYLFRCQNQSILKLEKISKTPFECAILFKNCSTTFF